MDSLGNVVYIIGKLDKSGGKDTHVYNGIKYDYAII